MINKSKIDAMRKLIDDLVSEKGNVTASEIVKKSKPASALTHACFEWNDKKAGSEYRLIEARKWIRIINVKTEKQISSGIERSILVSVPSLDGYGEGTYEPIRSIVENPSKFERAMRSALSDLDSSQKRVDELKDAAQEMGDDDKVAVLAGLLMTLQTAGDILRKMQ